MTLEDPGYPSDFDALMEHHHATERELAALKAAVGQPALRALLEALLLAQKWLANSMPVVELDGPKPLPVLAVEIKKLEALLSSEPNLKKEETKT